MPHKFKASSGISFLLLSGFVLCPCVLFLFSLQVSFVHPPFSHNNIPPVHLWNGGICKKLVMNDELYALDPDVLFYSNLPQ